ncbi:MAG TPA: cupredoxin domain-containing protein [Patescibacteria group bacterium]|nr:cupredoxin domain-containing protein [Patescibacteria group bacterium]
MDKIIVTFTGFGIIVFIYWFFLMKKEKAVVAGTSIDILVEGGYTPTVISIAKGQKTKINFRRTDANSCLEEVVISDFNIRRHLPLNEQVTIEILPKQEGIFVYTCGMSMFHGKIIVK